MNRALLLPALLITQLAHAGHFHASSPAFATGFLPNAQVLNGFGCTGDNRSPAVHWTSVPTGTRSLAVTLYDPDAPTGSGWWHWVVYNIPADVTALPENAGSGAGLPTGALQARTDFGTAAYGGACPPAGQGKHRYILSVYALDIATLPVPAEASPALIGFMIHQHRLGAAVLQTRYGH